MTTTHMKQMARTMAAVALVVSGAWTPATAQPVSDEWQVVVAPYLMGAAMDGTTTVRGREGDVSVSASDIFSNLQFGAMGLLEAKKGQWGFGTDVIWMALGSTVREINVDFNQGAFAFYGIRRLGAAADLTFGARVNTLQGELDFKTIGVRVDRTRPGSIPSSASPCAPRPTASCSSGCTAKSVASARGPTSPGRPSRPWA